MPFDERQKELSLFSLEKRRLGKDLTIECQYVMSSYKEDGGFFFKEATWRRQRRKGTDYTESGFTSA